MNTGTQTICLVMLLRPGTEITSKCLESVAPFIDSWVILACQPARKRPDHQLVESGKRVTEILGHLPGETDHHGFTGFSGAYGHAFSLAREMADTVLMLEADERIQCLDSGIFLPRGADIGLVEIRTPRFSLRQPRLLRSGITVEFLDSVTGQAGQTVFDDTHIYDTVAHVNILPQRYGDGIRRTDILTLKDDIARLQSGLGADWAQAASPDRLNILLSIAHSWLESDKAKKAAKYFEAIIDQVTDVDQTTGNMAELYWQAR